MKFQVCDCCGKQIDDTNKYLIEISPVANNIKTPNTTKIDLCSKCYKNLFAEMGKFTYNGELPERADHDFLSKEDYYAFYILFKKYFKNKTKLRKVFNHFFDTIDKKIDDLMSEEEMNNIVELSQKLEKEIF